MDYIYKDLVEAAKAGDQEAKLKLLNKLKPLVYSAIKRYGRGQDPDDLKQEARLALLEGIIDYDEGRGIPFLSYVKTLVYFRIHNLTRYQGRETSLNASIDSEEAKEFIDLLADEDADTVYQLIKKERLNALRDALDSLNPRLRYVIDQHYYKGRTLKAIASDLDLSYKTILRDKNRAVEILSNLLIE